ncbi:F0F1 ATP synthase subunit B [Mycobacterium sp.]|uniref:F0F1 ATP synthase subunit B n=1 Tax=Mycobacterium sp. TaxID=1785 RepID=UPI003C7283E1
MGEVTMTFVAEEGGQSNFLVPNGTFFVVLIIFLIVLGVIGTFVVPPVMRVLHERDEMVTKTMENGRQADKQFAAADADYKAEMARARREASGVRDEARSEGRKILEDMKGRASEQAALAMQKATEELKQQSDAISADLRASMETLAATLASRVLGVDVGQEAAAKTGR